MRFFTPLPNFIPWLSKEFNKHKLPIIDCGCGDGDLVRELRAAKLPCLGVDPRYDMFDEKVPFDLISAIVSMQAQEFAMVKHTPSILLVCRPCHSGFPIQIFNAMCRQSVLYYIGLKHNIETDLGSLYFKKVLKGPVGIEDEHLYSVGK